MIKELALGLQAIGSPALHYVSNPCRSFLNMSGSRQNSQAGRVHDRRIHHGRIHHQGMKAGKVAFCPQRDSSSSPPTVPPISNPGRRGQVELPAQRPTQHNEQRNAV
jgi:hypothetical protein